MSTNANELFRNPNATLGFAVQTVKTSLSNIISNLEISGGSSSSTGPTGPSGIAGPTGPTGPSGGGVTDLQGAYDNGNQILKIPTKPFYMRNGGVEYPDIPFFNFLVDATFPINQVALATIEQPNSNVASIMVFQEVVPEFSVTVVNSSTINISTGLPSWVAMGQMNFFVILKGMDIPANNGMYNVLNYNAPNLTLEELTGPPINLIGIGTNGTGKLIFINTQMGSQNLTKSHMDIFMAPTGEDMQCGLRIVNVHDNNITTGLIHLDNRNNCVITGQDNALLRIDNSASDTNAPMIALRNPNVASPDINFSQKSIDPSIFDTNMQSGSFWYNQSAGGKFRYCDAGGIIRELSTNSFLLPVGVSETYTTVGAAISAGYTLLTLVTNTIENTSVTVEQNVTIIMNGHTMNIHGPIVGPQFTAFILGDNGINYYGMSFIGPGKINVFYNRHGDDAFMGTSGGAHVLTSQNVDFTAENALTTNYFRNNIVGYFYNCKFDISNTVGSIPYTFLSNPEPGTIFENCEFDGLGTSTTMEVSSSSGFSDVTFQNCRFTGQYDNIILAVGNDTVKIINCSSFITSLSQIMYCNHVDGLFLPGPMPVPISIAFTAPRAIVNNYKIPDASIVIGEVEGVINMEWMPFCIISNSDFRTILNIGENSTIENCNLNNPTPLLANIGGLNMKNCRVSLAGAIQVNSLVPANITNVDFGHNHGTPTPITIATSNNHFTNCRRISKLNLLSDKNLITGCTFEGDGSTSSISIQSTGNMVTNCIINNDAPAGVAGAIEVQGMYTTISGCTVGVQGSATADILISAVASTGIVVMGCKIGGSITGTPLGAGNDVANTLGW